MSQIASKFQLIKLVQLGYKNKSAGTKRHKCLVVTYYIEDPIYEIINIIYLGRILNMLQSSFENNAFLCTTQCYVY